MLDDTHDRVRVPPRVRGGWRGPTRGWLRAACLPLVLAAGLTAATGAQAAGPGTVVAWGTNYYGESTVPSGLSNVTAIAAGAYHNLALIGPASPPPGGCTSSCPPPSAIPEADSLALFGLGFVGLVGYARQRYTARRRSAHRD